MTMTQHTQTSAPNTAPATSVSPLEQSGSSKTKFAKGKAKPKTDIYQVVTDSIVEALEMGVKPWVCPWKRNGAVSGIPSNFSTGAAYSGMNIMLLWCSAAKQGFTDSRWLTYNQAKERGAQVRKGETGTTGIFYKAVIRRLEQAVLRNHRIIISAITYAEMLFGAVGKKASPRHGQLVDAFCARLDAILPWDRAAIDATASVKAALTAAGTPIGPNDTAIAGHAIAAPFW